ncbi:hypothetical protein BST42_06295 [Mycolicibacterium rhodesiae]|uniref:Uncharacterized protein n=1 Tax=Mycolicibacterium rhodesiae TaxID=36814 RepID=A0A1X0J3E0_MYCRH|nr:hypothetical protein BST42_06295 [Mycolicibacterium rhodesiae]
MLSPWFSADRDQPVTEVVLRVARRRSDSMDAVIDATDTNMMAPTLPKIAPAHIVFSGQPGRAG